ncbi:universal stress protein [Mucilaginibacter psychrotolerans]|uniref:Universal stress protein n=1 Tax=Mucilaginibacter psychrotolerans TaxID=1524096 RepID=A0A4Y8SAN8_9SPHI|nr:universal stress protein [Mucilaginibacter psychrotolerans]TFF35680.1 universal stress protein [Mucilaginibacter psychrotolerans]
MKKLLVLTNFSDEAAEAAKFAAVLCQQLKADIILYNSFLSQPVMPDLSGSAWMVGELAPVQEYQQELSKLSHELASIVLKTPPGLHQPKIHEEEGEGSLGLNVKEINNKDEIEMVVMGAPQGSGLEHFLSGSDTASVIDHSTRPVMIYPQGSNVKNLHKVVFATDFNAADLIALNYLEKLSHVVKFQVTVVHVNEFGEAHLPLESEKSFFNQLKKIDMPGLTYESIRGKDTVERLANYLGNSKADLLVLMHRKRSFFKELFGSSTTKTMMKRAIPLLVIPSDMKG